MALFGKKIKTWEDLLVFKHIPKKIENEEVVHQAFCLPTKELATITLKEIKRLIKKGQDPNWKDCYGKPLLAHLMEAQPWWERECHWNGIQPEIIDYLLKNGANPNVSYMDSYFQKETTLFQEVACGNINSHNEPSVYIKLLLANGVDVTYQDAGIKSVVELLTSSITPSIERAKMILSTGKIDIEKPVIDGKSSVLDCVKEKYFVAEKSQDYLYQYYKTLSSEKAERWYSDILAERHRKEELERREQQKRQELAEYKRKQQEKNRPTADDYVQALHITSAALGVMSAYYGLVATAQKCQEQYEIANSPIGRFKRMLGIRSY